jgi:hypothetical protein
VDLGLGQPEIRSPLPDEPAKARPILSIRIVVII